AAALGRVTFDEIGVDALVNRSVTARRRRGWRRTQKLLRARIELLLRDVAIGNEIARDAAEPFFIVAIFEIVERIERLRALAQVGPGPYRAELARRRRKRELRAQRHHRHMDAEDALLPILDENTFLEIDRPEPFQPTKVMLKFHRCFSRSSLWI